MRKKSVLFIDFPQIANGAVRYNFYELFRNFGQEFDEIKTFAKIPREPKEEKDTWGIIRVATNAGAFPTLYPSDVDPFLVEDIRRTLERKDIKEIAILSGDNGYYAVLRTAKRAGMKIKVILPTGNNSYLLRSVADEIVTIEDYAREYIPETSLRMKGFVFQTIMKDKKVIKALNRGEKVG